MFFHHMIQKSNVIIKLLVITYKCGGCTVLGIMKAVSELKLPINVVGIIPSVENMPGGDPKQQPKSPLLQVYEPLEYFF